MGKEMEMLIFGKKGTPVVIFPSEEGRFFEWEDAGIMEALREQAEEGYNQFFCVDSVNEESFLNKSVDPYVRISRQKQYEDYIMDEVLPQIKERNSNGYIVFTGANLGAYQALLLALKHPGKVHKVISISGTFDIKPHLDGFYDDNVYYNNPVDFIPNLNDLKVLKKISEIDIRLLSYKNDPLQEATRRMSDTLWIKNLEHEFYIWDEEVSEPWQVVAPMIREHLF